AEVGDAGDGGAVAVYADGDGLLEVLAGEVGDAVAEALGLVAEGLDVGGDVGGVAEGGVPRVDGLEAALDLGDPLLGEVDLALDPAGDEVGEAGLDGGELALELVDGGAPEAGLDGDGVALAFELAELGDDALGGDVEVDGALARHVVADGVVEVLEAAGLALDLALEERPRGVDAGAALLPRHVDEGLGVDVGDEGGLGRDRAHGRDADGVDVVALEAGRDVAALEAGRDELDGGLPPALGQEDGRGEVGAGDAAVAHEDAGHAVGEGLGLPQHEELVREVGLLLEQHAAAAGGEHVGQPAAVLADEEEAGGAVDRRLEEGVRGDGGGDGQQRREDDPLPAEDDVDQ